MIICMISRGKEAGSMVMDGSMLEAPELFLLREEDEAEEDKA